MKEFNNEIQMIFNAISGSSGLVPVTPTVPGGKKCIMAYGIVRLFDQFALAAETQITPSHVFTGWQNVLLMYACVIPWGNPYNNSRDIHNYSYLHIEHSSRRRRSTSRERDRHRDREKSRRDSGKHCFMACIIVLSGYRVHNINVALLAFVCNGE